MSRRDDRSRRKGFPVEPASDKRRQGPIWAWAVRAVVLLALVSFVWPPSIVAGKSRHREAQPILNLGTKNFAEEYLVADMYQLLLEKGGFKVRQHRLGITPVLHYALVHGDIDLYPEYTGTGLLDVLHRQRSISDPAKAYATVKAAYQRRFHLTWLAQSPMDDTDGVAVSGLTARKYRLHTLSDLARVANRFTFAGLSDCENRLDCMQGLERVYGIKFRKTLFLTSQSFIYSALKTGRANVIEVFTTDAMIKAAHLVVLKDDKHIFPADHIAPVVRDVVLSKYPRIKPILNRIAPYITTGEMIRMNELVVLKNEDPMAVARAFLRHKHLL